MTIKIIHLHLELGLELVWTHCKNLHGLSNYCMIIGFNKQVLYISSLGIIVIGN